jgi:hypothetical protein
MKANMPAVVAICVLAGVAVSCKTAPHALLGPIDYPQAVDGKIRWSSADGNNYDIQFNPSDSPCKEGALIHVVTGQVATCTVVGRGLLYTYAVTQVNLTKGMTVATIIAHRAVIVPCRACGEFQTMLHRQNVVSVGALIALQGSPAMTTVLQSACAPTSTNDACLYQGQTVEWQLDGSGPQLEVDFTAGSTPCADGRTQLMGSATSSPVTLPLACTTATGSATTQTYKYTFKVNGGAAIDNGSTVTVMKAP